MDNPVLVDVTRGALVESRHRGTFVVVDGDGAIIASAGDIERPVFPRSAVKAFQALPLIETGAADRFGFGDAELALAISSHNGEQRHVDTARAMLAAGGLHEGCLACGAHWPGRGRDQAVLHRMGADAARIHNNCSGKHSGFLCTAIAMGAAPEGYNEPGHPLMKAVVAAVADMTGAFHGEDNCGTDGCSIPTYAIPLTALGRGFARFATGNGLSATRAAAARRLMAAAAAEPFMVAGTSRFCTKSMTILGSRAFVKTGAEGVFIAVLPETGISIAVKIDDGAARASEVVTAHLLAHYLGIEEGDPMRAALEPLMRVPIKSWAGELCGHIEASAGLKAALN